MIVTRTPIRISLFGGGWDYPEHYREHGGRTLGIAINRLSYLCVNPIPECRVKRCLLRLERAVRERRIFHLWFHPINFIVRMPDMLAVPDRVLEAAARLRAAGQIEIHTMGSLRDRLEGHPSG
jgi:hypothetical protein